MDFGPMGQGLTPFYKAVHKMNRVPTPLPKVCVSAFCPCFDNICLVCTIYNARIHDFVESFFVAALCAIWYNKAVDNSRAFRGTKSPLVLFLRRY